VVGATDERTRLDVAEAPGAGLVTERREGTRRLYRLDPDALGELRDYFDDFWSEALAAFKAAAEDERRNG